MAKPNSQIVVASLRTAHQKAENWADQVISLVDLSFRKFWKFETVDQHLMLKFDDVDFDCPSGPTEDLIRKALDFARDDTRIVVHCHAGLCRSTAMAFAILVRRGLSYEEAISKVLESSFDAWPNNLVIRHADCILNHDGKMVEFISNWKKNVQLPSWLR